MTPPTEPQPEPPTPTTEPPTEPVTGQPITTTDTFWSVISDLHAAVSAEEPATASALGAALADEPIGFVLAGEHLTLTASGVVRGASEGTRVLLIADGARIHELISGRTDIVAAARHGGFDVVGPPAALERAERALRLFILGAVRLRCADSLYDRMVSLCVTAPEEADRVA